LSLVFHKAGIQTSIQDLGRFGLMHLGIGRSGAMDSRSMKLANWLVGKPLDAAVFEVTMIGPSIEVEQDIAIAICGAEFEIFHNNKPTSINRVINLSKGERLEFKQRKQGMRAYISFTGELDLPKVSDSYSTHLAAMIGSLSEPIKNQQRIKIRSSYKLKERSLQAEHTPFYSGNYLIRCVPSVETSLFEAEIAQQFYQLRFQVSAESNRMGIRLQGDKLKLEHSMEIASSGLTEGSIQIPPSGQPIISSVDGQTVGGYPRIANVIHTDLPLLGQLVPNDTLSFELIDIDYAEQLLLESNSIYSRLKV
jgi:biotin-dependent carboxylase-like uncharacterized protein